MAPPVRFTALFLVTLLIGVQFIPKMDLGARLKPDDILYVGSMLLLVPFMRRLPTSVLMYLGTLAALAATQMATLLLAGSALGVLFVGRYTAYGLSVAVGAWLQSTLTERTGLTLWRMTGVFAGLQLGVVLGQQAGLLPSIIDNSLGEATGRATGFASHPTELGFLNLLLLTLVYQLTHAGQRTVSFYAVVTALLVAIVAADSRTSLIGGLAMLLMFEVFARRGTIRARTVRWLIAPVLLAGATAVALQSERIGEALSSRNAAFTQKTLSDRKSVRNFTFIYPQFAPTGVDPSLYIRMTKWGSVLSDVEEKPLLGAGPGAYGVAIDGLYIRVLGESGIIGFALYVLGLGIIFFNAKSYYYRTFFVVIVISSIFIDALFFSRFAYVFYLYAGLQMAGGVKAIESLAVDTRVLRARTT